MYGSALQAKPDASGHTEVRMKIVGPTALGWSRDRACICQSGLCWQLKQPNVMFAHTFAILVLRNDLTRNLNRSSSVWMTMRRKLVFGSMLPTCSSTTSIWIWLAALALPMIDPEAADLLAGGFCPVLVPSTLMAKAVALVRSSR